MPNSQAKPIVEGGLLAALSVAIALASIYIPYANLIWPLPIALLGARHSVRWSMMTAVIGALVIGITVHITQGLFLLLGGGLVGVVLGECLRRGMAAGRTLVVGTVSAVISNLVLIGAVMAIMQVDLVQMNTDMQDTIVRVVTELSQQMGGDEAQRAQIEALGAEMARAYAMLLPSGLFIYALFTAALNFILARVIMRRLRMEVPPFSPFESWRFPGWVLYLFVLSIVGTYWGGKWASDMMLAASENVRVVTSFALFVQGLSLIYYASRRNMILKKIWWFLVIFAFISPLFNIMLIVLGGIDILMNYRKNREKQV